jgi:hypothetical protein
MRSPNEPIDDNQTITILDSIHEKALWPFFVFLRVLRVFVMRSYVEAERETTLRTRQHRSSVGTATLYSFASASV